MTLVLQSLHFVVSVLLPGDASSGKFTHNVMSVLPGDGSSAKSWDLKVYYEIVKEARPLSGFFFSTHADFFTEMHF